MNPEIRYANLNDGMKMPTIGFGTWQIANETAKTAVLGAIEAGYRNVDTAAIYGNEEGVGAALKEMPIKRNELFLSTKVWNSEHGYDSTLRAMDQSLKKLKTDYVDLYLIHWPAPKNDKYTATWKALIRLRQEGLARSIGVSNFNQEHLERIIGETGVIPAVNQVELHPYFQQRELRAFHDQHQIITQAWSPLAQGTMFEDALLKRIADDKNKSVSQIILRWHYQNGLVAIPKSTNTKRQIENFSLFDFSLSEHEMELIDSLDRGAEGRVGPNPLTADF